MSNKHANTPWSGLDETGEGLTVDAFITTLMSQVGNALRRTITVPYAEQFGLTVSEWRLLSLISHAQRLAFSDLVIQSTSDKALVSRTLKLLEARGLVELQGEGNTPRKKIYCQITEAGESLHSQAIPVAWAHQASAICAIPAEDRDAVFRGLMYLREYCLNKETAKEPASASDDIKGLDC